jgi:CheY-like chemotaxis protein
LILHWISDGSDDLPATNYEARVCFAPERAACHILYLAAKERHRGPRMSETRHRRILIVEDELLIAMLVEQMVEDLGYAVVGPALTVEEALSLIEREPIDCAVLDMNLGQGVSSTPIAEALHLKGIPFMFASGYGSKGAIENLSAAPILNKPFLTQDLEKALHRILP